MRREVIGRLGQRALVKAQRGAAGLHAVRVMGGILGTADQQQQLHIGRLLLAHRCEPIAVLPRSACLRRVARTKLQRSQLDAKAFASAHALCQRLRAGRRGPGARRVAELGQRIAQAHLRERDAVVGAQGLVERSGRFDPEERVEVREALVVKGLRGFR